ncbi:MAG TPA: lmo0937 family membrane protein [Thermomicrobiaceae bacterium]|nr:lmo0937 family membrane protein [Thermomicrobiaceae bacterium]
MLWAVIVLLVILWVLGFGVFHVAGALIHLLLVIALVVLVIQLLTGRSAV